MAASAFSAIRCRNRATSSFPATFLRPRFGSSPPQRNRAVICSCAGRGLNDTRTALLGVLIRMGAQVREAIEDVDQVEPRGTVEVTGAPLKGTVIQGKEIPQLIDELPILAVAGALASGTTIIRHAQELRVKETDRIAAIAHNLRAMGAQVIELNDGLEIHGRAELRGARVASFGDHRIAMAFAVAGMFADGETIVQDVECVRESYPGFEKALDEFVLQNARA